MKRMKPYSSDSDEDSGKPSPAATSRDWSRRDQDPNRSHIRSSSSSSHPRKISSLSTYDRPSFDEDREISRPPPRKRFDYDFDRRKSFERYRDSSFSSSSSLGQRGDRLYRCESFSELRREFPKGFRSERDRSRRGSDGRSGSSWWKSSGSRDVGGVPGAVGEAKMSLPLSVELASEDRRGRVRVRESASSESQRSDTQSKTETEKKGIGGGGDDGRSGSSSEMEEGELEPEQEHVQREMEPEELLRSETVAQCSGDVQKDAECAESGLGSERFNCGLQSESVVECSADLEKDVEVAVESGSERFRSSDCEMDVEFERKEEQIIEDEVGVDGRCDEGDDAMEVVADAVTTEVDSVDKIENDMQLAANSREECRGKVPDGIGELNVVEGKLCTERPEIDQNEIFAVQQSHSDERISRGECGQMAEGDKVENVRSDFCLQETNVVDCQIDDKSGVNVNRETKLMETANLNIDVGKERRIDLEVVPTGSSYLPSSSENIVDMDRSGHRTLPLMEVKPKDKDKDNGKSLAICMSSKESSGDDNVMEGRKGRGFELLFCSEFGQSTKAQNFGVSIDRNKEKSKVESLDLSLSLPSGFANNPSSLANVKPESPVRARSIQSTPSSFPTDSNGFTMSVSLTSSQPFSHNPSCSLNQNSMDNFEHSVGSRPLFQRVDQASSTPIWQAQASNESKRKGATPLLQRVLLDGNTSYSSHHNSNQNHPKPNELLRTYSAKSSPTHSVGSRDSKSEHNKDKRLLLRERSSNSLFKSDEQGHLVANGAGVTEKIVSKIITDPLYLSSRMVQEMTENSIAYLKQTIWEMLSDTGKIRKVQDLQEQLKSRSDLTMETLSRCPNVLLEILVALKTGLPGFIKRGNIVSASDLCEMFLDLKCCNLACRNMLPVDDCDCKVCTQKAGFCSACMCLICHKFDNASNTCSWVGCDVCLHWCHTDCGLRHSYIRSERCASGGGEMSEMRFHCVACNHPSEMFGFVKELFRTCAKDWKAETLVKELQCVQRIFSASNDLRGKRLHDVAGQMLLKLENKVNQSDVVSYLMEFLSGDGTNIGNCSSFPTNEQSLNVGVLSNGIYSSSRDTTWCLPIPTQKASLHENVGVLSSMDSELGSRKALHADVQANTKRKVPSSVETKPIIEELDSVVKFKQAEAKLYQERADEARREAEGLRRIATAKNARIDEDYASRIAKVRLTEAEERRRQKLEEVKAIERADSEFFNMKMRMEADIKDLLLKMEATRRNFDT